MITFSCKKITKEDLIKCAFSLNKTEYELLVFMLKKKGKYSANQISAMVRLDRTTIQKAIKKLANEGLVTRLQKNMPGGGYTFLYTIADKKEIKGRIKKVIRIWCRGVERAVNEM